MNTIGNLILLPFRAIWNLLVLGLLIWAFVAWWGLFFIIPVVGVLVLLLATDLLFLPMVIVILFTPMWDH